MAMSSDIRYTSFPHTEPPPSFVPQVVDVFRGHEHEVSTLQLTKGLNSDQVLAVLRDDLVSLGFEVESGKRKEQKIVRPVFFGENSVPELQYEIHAYHPKWECGLEIEAGRAWMGNAVYRDLIQALVMVHVQYLILAVPIAYKYNTRGHTVVSHDCVNASAVANALYGHSRLKMPYDLLLVGY